jgi:hypothetical protein
MSRVHPDDVARIAVIAKGASENLQTPHEIC